MRAAVYHEFGGPIAIEPVGDPTPPDDGVVIAVRATGLCRSDWHGWQGHDSDIQTLPHVPGHELAGEIVAVGREVRRWQTGARVTTPFVCGCGVCAECASGNQQVCAAQTQPGFHHWGSFAEYVMVRQADVNLVALPDSMEYVTAASLGCRFATAFRAVVEQGRVQAGEWLVVYGCGGVGLSAVMIGSAAGAQVVAVDINPAALAQAASLGAVVTINARETDDVVAAVREATQGGAQVSLDALGSRETAFNAVASLRRRGRHVQVGLLAGADFRAPLPLERVIAHELVVYGSHGLPAHRYPAMLTMIAQGRLQPQRLIGQRIGLDAAPAALMTMGQFGGPAGVTVVEEV